MRNKDEGRTTRDVEEALGGRCAGLSGEHEQETSKGEVAI